MSNVPFTHWKKLRNPKYIGAYELEYETDKFRTINVSILSISAEEVKTDKTTVETVAQLNGMRPLILNSTNCKILAKLFQTNNVNEWIGRMFTLEAKKIKAFGEWVYAIRVSPKLPEANAKANIELVKGSKAWHACIEALKNKSFTMEQIEKKYVFDLELKNELIKLSNE